MAIEDTAYLRLKDPQKIDVQRTDGGFTIVEHQNQQDPFIGFEIFCNPGKLERGHLQLVTLQLL